MSASSMIKVFEPIDWSTANELRRASVLQRPPLPSGTFQADVSSIISRVREDGDKALIELGEKHDGVRLQRLGVGADEWAEAESMVAPVVLEAMDDAISNINDFHVAGKPESLSMETSPGLRCEARYQPITPVGLYVPGGSAPLISTVIMLAVPARIAACKQVILCTPPDPEGRISPAILAAASRCGIKHVFKVGGAQAIAAMGLGTESIPACAKLFGPGNAWVTEAKQQIAAIPGGAARDMPAGPSEVLVIADKNADATSVCWDLLSQAEHGPDSQAILLSECMELLETVCGLLPEMIAGSARTEILKQSSQYLRCIKVNTIVEAVRISNQYAPEHLILNLTDAEEVSREVTAAGSVFIGPWSPESLGDYCSGTNHVLPTYGYARSYSGLSVNDFMRRMTLQRATQTGLQNTGRTAMTLARAEGLDAHAMAVEHRLNLGNGSKQWTS